MTGNYYLYMVKLKEILKEINDIRIAGNENLEISGINYDSRKVSPGDLFVAIKGGTFDGHEYIDAAIEQGACAVMGENNITDCSVPYVRVGNSREGLAYASSAFYGYPGRSMTMIGITALCAVMKALSV